MKKDVFEYVTTMQKDYNKLLEVLEKVNKEVEEGEVSDEQRANFEKYVMTVKSNYDRVMYIVHLLNLPPKFIQRFQEKQLLIKQKKFENKMKKAKATTDEVSKENKEALKSINEGLKELDGNK